MITVDILSKLTRIEQMAVTLLTSYSAMQKSTTSRLGCTTKLRVHILKLLLEGFGRKSPEGCYTEAGASEVNDNSRFRNRDERKEM